MDAGSIQGLFAGLGFAKEALGAALQGKIDAETQKSISEAMLKLDAAQSTIYQMRNEMFDMQEKNHALKEEIREVLAWKSRVDNYGLVKTDGGAIVYLYSGDPAHYACPRCVESKTIQILQDDNAHSGTYSCPGCHETYKINPSRPLPTPRVTGGNWN